MLARYFFSTFSGDVEEEEEDDDDDDANDDDDDDDLLKWSTYSVLARYFFRALTLGPPEMWMMMTMTVVICFQP